jgi:threonine synthase
MVIDPHSAVGLSAARAARATRLVADDIPIISLACAHPAKFPDAVKSVTGAHPALPNHMADLMEREERLSVIENDISDVQAFVKAGMRS